MRFPIHRSLWGKCQAISPAFTYHEQFLAGLCSGPYERKCITRGGLNAPWVREVGFEPTISTLWGWRDDHFSTPQWYLWVDLNHRPTTYEAVALTNWATQAFLQDTINFCKLSDSNRLSIVYQTIALTIWAKLAVADLLYVSLWYSCRGSNPVLHLERVATQPLRPQEHIRATWTAGYPGNLMF